MRYVDLDNYPDRGIEKNLPPLGIDPFTAEFTLKMLPIEQVGFYRREDHWQKCAARVDMFVHQYKYSIGFWPIIAVETAENFYSVPDGYHRLHAIHILGLPDVEAYVVT